MEMEHLVRLIFILVGMDRIAILVDLFKVGGLPMNCFSNKVFRLQEMAILL